MEYNLFFDDGGVLNDNGIRGMQWKTYVGEFYSEKFGGNPEDWGEANQKLITKYLESFWIDGSKRFKDFESFYNAFKKQMIIGLFEESNNFIPQEINFFDVFDATIGYVIPKVRSAIPGVIDIIKELKSKYFKLYTAAGAVSNEMKLYLEGMGIVQLFEEYYGPDLINTWKSGPDFYMKILQHSGVDASKAIFIEDNPRFLKSALEVGANVIQVCITGEYSPQFPFYVEDMRDLPLVIDSLIYSLE